MASIDFKKVSDMSKAKGLIVHCDEDERVIREHKNKDIDKSLTRYNFSTLFSGDLSAEKKYQRLVDRLQFLDSTTNKNHRKDRVNMIAVNVPEPAGLRVEDRRAWFEEVTKIFVDDFGLQNFVYADVHCDEMHEYHAADGKHMSRAHLHIGFVPELDGKLNAKKISSRSTFNKVNNQIQKMSAQKFGIKFMDGSAKKSSKTLEELKNESEVLALQSLIDQKQQEVECAEFELEKVQAQISEGKKLVSKIKRAKIEGQKIVAEKEKAESELAEVCRDRDDTIKLVDSLKEELSETEKKLNLEKEDLKKIYDGRRGHFVGIVDQKKARFGKPATVTVTEEDFEKLQAKSVLCDTVNDEYERLKKDFDTERSYARSRREENDRLRDDLHWERDLNKRLKAENEKLKKVIDAVRQISQPVYDAAMQIVEKAKQVVQQSVGRSWRM